MAFKIAKDPLVPDPPIVHDPLRCMNCGHHKDVHAPSPVGCTVDGGTKYIVDEETGVGIRACSCTEYVPVPEEMKA